MFVAGAAPVVPGVTAIDATTLADGGAILRWLAARGAEAVLVRPDHYVYGTGSPPALIAARVRQLGLAMETVI